MGRYKALENIRVGEGEKKDHKDVKKDEVFECDTDYAETHLNPLDGDEEYNRKLHHAHLVQETEEPVTAEKKAEERKKVKLSKKEAAAKAKADKAAAKADKE